MIRVLIIGAVLLGLASTKTNAQEIKPYLVVKVLDELGKPLSNARVTVSKNKEPVADEFTDSSGTRIIAVLDLGTYVVSIDDGSKTQIVELFVKKGHNELLLEMGREQLSPIAVEAEPVLISDAYSGSVSSGCFMSTIRSSCPVLRSRQWVFNSTLVGGMWLSDTRAPTFQNVLNVQPND